MIRLLFNQKTNEKQEKKLQKYKYNKLKKELVTARRLFAFSSFACLFSAEFFIVECRLKVDLKSTQVTRLFGLVIFSHQKWWFYFSEVAVSTKLIDFGHQVFSLVKLGELQFCPSLSAAQDSLARGTENQRLAQSLSNRFIYVYAASLLFCFPDFSLC